MKQMKLVEIFPEHLLDKAWNIGRDHDQLIALCRQNLAEINMMTDQENDPGFLAYQLEYAMGVAAL